MTVLGLSAGLVTGSVLKGFTGFTGEIANPENADFGDADFADAGAGLAATASDWGVTAAGMGDTAGVVVDAAGVVVDTASGSAATPSDFVVAASGSADTVSASAAAASGLGFAAAFLCTATADFGDAASCSADAAAELGVAALEIKEAAKTAPAVSKAERLKLIFSPKAEWIKKKGFAAGTSYGARLELLLPAHRTVPGSNSFCQSAMLTDCVPTESVTLMVKFFLPPLPQSAVGIAP
jgi:hypothetical protein